MKGTGSLLVGLSMAGLVFSMWFAGAAFLVPMLFRFLVPDLLFVFVMNGLILSSLYSVIHYKLHGVVFWPVMVAGSVVGGLLAYLLMLFAGSVWPLEVWITGLAVFTGPPILISVVKTLSVRGKPATVAVVETVEPVTATAPATETQQAAQETQPKPQPQITTQKAPQQEPTPSTVETTTPAISQVMIYQEGLKPAEAVQKIDSEDFEDYILDFIDSKKITELVPVISPSDDGGVYPMIQDEIDIDTTRLNIVLKRLLDKGIIRIGGIEFKRIACPRCYSSSVMFSISCKSCKSPNISRQRILQHESCGYLGPEERFLEGGRYMCPRCGTEVTVAKEPEEETMHDKVKVHSSLFICYQCNEVNNEPLVSFRCITCGMEFDYNSLELKTFYRYLVSLDSLSKVLEHNKPVKLIIEEMRLLGYKVEKNVKVVGSSNLTHRVDLLVSKDGVKKALIMFLKSDRKDEQVNNIMKVMTMKLDLTDLDFYVLSYFPLHAEAKRLMELFNIWYIESVLTKNISAIVSSLFAERKV
ncbi:MAG: hypothetical protein NZ581_00655 [Candidatus Caldarchaeum sp.]|nr:hypothetical protein [Candidatus Caldarchaeum sp.]MDW8434698.1 hypothetical protein [Candidatus Caldarchaeum sp.]